MKEFKFEIEGTVFSFKNGAIYNESGSGYSVEYFGDLSAFGENFEITQDNFDAVLYHITGEDNRDLTERVKFDGIFYNQVGNYLVSWVDGDTREHTFKEILNMKNVIPHINACFYIGKSKQRFEYRSGELYREIVDENMEYSVQKIHLYKKGIEKKLFGEKIGKWFFELKDTNLPEKYTFDKITEIAESYVI